MDKVSRPRVREVELNVGDLHTTAADIQRRRADERSAPARPAPALNRKESVHQHNGWFVELMDGDERRLWASDLTPNLGPRDAACSEWCLEFQRVSVMSKKTRPRPGPTAADPRRRADGLHNRDIPSIDRWQGGGLRLLVAAPLAGYWLAGRAVRPLAAIIKTTAGLRPNRMEERLPTGQTDDELDQLSRHGQPVPRPHCPALFEPEQRSLGQLGPRMRTPLAAIRSSVEVALAGDRTPQEYEELLTEVIDECVSLERLVNQLLLLSETDSERLRSRSEPVGLSAS